MTAASEETISALELLELSNNDRLGRATEAAELTARALVRLADASERQAATLETLTVLLASTIGRATSICYPDNSNGKITTPNVNYFRVGDGSSFKCDAGDDDDE